MNSQHSWKVKVKAVVTNSITDNFYFLSRRCIFLNSVSDLKRLFHWNEDPLLDDPDLAIVDHVEDANQRRLRDAEVIGAVVRNVVSTAALEIGTSTGHTTALMAANAMGAQIYTVNIPPEDINRGEGGIFTTHALDTLQIGNYYREKGFQNVHQILANTKTWQPQLEQLDLAFIDGCHDTEFVINDTLKILPFMKKGGFILWHDFNPELARKFPWIKSVCAGVESLLFKNKIVGRIFVVRDSWVGIYRVPI